MLKIGKLTDYGILLLTYLAQDPNQTSRTTRDLAGISRLPLPTVEKLLKALSRAKFLVSERGVKGGYRLARPAGQIHLAEIIESLEGPIALTECSRTAGGNCDVESHCLVQGHWRAISQTVRGALMGLTLEELAAPPRRPLSTVASGSVKQRVFA